MLRAPAWSSLLTAVTLVACGGATSARDAGADADAGTVVDAGAPPDPGQPADSGTPDAGPPLAAPLAVSASFELPDLTRTGNVVLVHVQDASGAPVEGATVTLTLTRPPPMQGAPAPSTVELGQGNYRAAPVDFTTAGDWTVTVTAAKAGLTASQALTVPVP